MTIDRATIILSDHMDTVVLHTDKPSSVPNVTKENLDVMFYAAYDGGEEYVKLNFPGIPIKIVPRYKKS